MVEQRTPVQFFDLLIFQDCDPVFNRSTMNGSFLRRDDPDALVQSGDADAKTLGRVLDPDGRVFQQGTNLLLVLGGELFRATTQASAGAAPP